MPNTNWLDELKVGEKVGVRNTRIGDRLVAITPVLHLHSKDDALYLDSGWFSRKTGVGEVKHHLQLVQLTDEVRAEAEEGQAKQSLIQRIEERDLFELPLSALERIAAIIEEQK